MSGVSQTGKGGQTGRDENSHSDRKAQLRRWSGERGGDGERGRGKACIRSQGIGAEMERGEGGNRAFRVRG